MGVTPINSLDEFRTIVNSGKPVVIDFWATWCGPCRAISPIFEKLSTTSGYENVEFYKVDIDEQEGVAQEVGVKVMPTFMLFKDGNKIDESTGAYPQKLQDLVKQAASLE